MNVIHMKHRRSKKQQQQQIIAVNTFVGHAKLKQFPHFHIHFYVIALFKAFSFSLSAHLSEPFYFRLFDISIKAYNWGHHHPLFDIYCIWYGKVCYCPRKRSHPSSASNIVHMPKMKWNFSSSFFFKKF